LDVNLQKAKNPTPYNTNPEINPEFVFGKDQKTGGRLKMVIRAGLSNPSHKQLLNPSKLTSEGVINRKQVLQHIVTYSDSLNKVGKIVTKQVEVCEMIQDHMNFRYHFNVLEENSHNFLKTPQCFANFLS
jgi:hypothetical protein